MTVTAEPIFEPLTMDGDPACRPRQLARAGLHRGAHPSDGAWAHQRPAPAWTHAGGRFATVRRAALVALGGGKYRTSVLLRVRRAPKRAWLSAAATVLLRGHVLEQAVSPA